MTNLWHNKIIPLFKADLYKDCIQQIDIIDELFDTPVRIETQPDGTKEETEMMKDTFAVVNFKERGRFLIKKDVVKELPIRYFPNKEGEPQTLWEVALGKKMYNYVVEYAQIGIKPEKRISFREMIDWILPVEHNYPDDLQILRFVYMSAKSHSNYIRVCGESKFGKTAVSSQFNELIPFDCVSLFPKSIPALQHYLKYKVMNLNEIWNVDAEARRLISQFLNQAADGSGTWNRGTMNPNVGGQMSYDISNLSILLYYNMPSEMDSCGDDKFFDKMFDEPIRNKIFPLYLRGCITHKFVAPVDREAEYQRCKLDMLAWAKTVQWYSDINTCSDGKKGNQHLIDEMHNYTRKYSFNHFNTRWQTTYDTILNVVDAYCNDQVEFDKWEELIYQRHKEYMTKFVGSCMDNFINVPEIKTINPPQTINTKNDIQIVDDSLAQQRKADKKKLIKNQDGRFDPNEYM